MPEIIQVPTSRPTHIRITRGTVMDLRFSFICSSISLHFTPQITAIALTMTVSTRRVTAISPFNTNLPTKMVAIAMTKRAIALPVLSSLEYAVFFASFIMRSSLLLNRLGCWNILEPTCCVFIITLTIHKNKYII